MKHEYAIGVAALLACMAAASGQAEAAEEAAPAVQGETAILEDVIVTARRREESLQTVPVAVSVVSGEDLTRARIMEAQDLQKLAPSLQTSQISRDDAFIVIRGQGPGVGAFPGVVTYFNDVPFRGLGQGFYYDLSEVQILKGPQGTLFGRNSNGGAILFRSTPAAAQFGGYVNAGVGDFDQKDVEGAVNIPVGERLAVRIAGAAAERSGFTRDLSTGRDLDDREFSSGRLSVRWTPADAVVNEIVADVLRVETNGSSAILFKLEPNSPLAFLPPPVLGGAQQLLAQQQALGPRVQVGSSAGNLRRVDGWGVMDRLEWRVSDALSLTNIASYRRYRRLSRADYDGTPLPLVDFSITPDGYDVDEEQFTEELQATGDLGAVGYTAGVYFQRSRPAGPQRQIGVLFFQPTLLINDAVDRSVATYAQLDYDAGFLLPGLTLSAGARYTWDRRYQRAATQNLATGACSGAGATPPTCLVEDVARFEAPNWTLTASWQASPDLLLYATARRGYKSGGLNLGQPFLARRVYRPEYLTDQEIGLKTDFDALGARLRLNLAAYRGDYEDVQVNALVTDTATSAIYNIVENGAEATIQGLEGELTARLGSSLELGLGYAFTDAQYDRYVSSIYGDLSGSAWPYTPRHKGVVSATWSPPLPEHLGAPAFSLRYSVQDRVQFGYEPDPFAREKAYGLLDANIDWRNVAGSDFDLRLFATNLTDETYKTGVIGLLTAAGLDSAVYGEPRMIGVQLAWRFGAEAQR